ncbi:MAG: SDR family oxidoreductase [Patescibacteria group bacterium]
MNSDKVAVVTGTSKGIGNAICKSLLGEGWVVYGISRSKCKDFLNNDNFHQLTFDLQDTNRLVEPVTKIPEKIDLIINNAGMWELALIKDVTAEHFDEIINLNLKAPVLLTSLLLSRLRSGSCVINISSIMGVYTEPEYGVYATTKAGLDRFTTTLAKERKDLRVIGVLPSATDTSANRDILGDQEDYSKYLIPDEVAQVVLRVVNGEFKSGDLIVVNNREFWKMWEERDTYKIIDVDN